MPMTEQQITNITKRYATEFQRVLGQYPFMVDLQQVLIGQLSQEYPGKNHTIYQRIAQQVVTELRSARAAV